MQQTRGLACDRPFRARGSGLGARARALPALTQRSRPRPRSAEASASYGQRTMAESGRRSWPPQSTRVGVASTRVATHLAHSVDGTHYPFGAPARRVFPDHLITADHWVGTHTHLHNETPHDTQTASRRARCNAYHFLYTSLSSFFFCRPLLLSMDGPTGSNSDAAIHHISCSSFGSSRRRICPLLPSDLQKCDGYSPQAS